MKTRHPHLLLCLTGMIMLTATLPPRTFAQHVHHDDGTAEVTGIVTAFREALSAGDSTTVARLLADDAMILESGKTETKQEYLSHHFHGDIAFLAAMTREPGATSVKISGDAAWATAVSRLHRSYNDRAVDLNSAELMVLKKTDAGWKIVALHWSSRSRS